MNISQATREKMRNAALAHWGTPEIRKKMISASNLAKRSKDVSIKISNAQKKRFSDLNQLESMRSRVKDVWKSEDYRNKNISSRILKFSTPETKIKMIEAKLLGGIWYGNVRYTDKPQYCEKFNTDFKTRVRLFWDNRCFECGEKHEKNLAVHHVHYDKKMCCNGSPRDVVPLCQSCHTKTNVNRDYWENHFTDLLYKYNPNGKCYLTKEEINQMRVINH